MKEQEEGILFFPDRVVDYFPSYTVQDIVEDFFPAFLRSYNTLVFFYNLLEEMYYDWGHDLRRPEAVINWRKYIRFLKEKRKISSAQEFQKELKKLKKESKRVAIYLTIMCMCLAISLAYIFDVISFPGLTPGDQERILTAWGASVVGFICASKFFVDNTERYIELHRLGGQIRQNRWYFEAHLAVPEIKENDPMVDFCLDYGQYLINEYQENKELEKNL